MVMWDGLNPDAKHDLQQGIDLTPGLARGRTIGKSVLDVRMNRDCIGYLMVDMACNGSG